MRGFKNRYELGKVEVVFIVLILVAVAVVGAFAWKIGNDKKNSINSFAECVAAGNPVMEKYPEQCAANGKSWSNPDQLLQEPNNVNNSGDVDENYLVISEWGVKLPLNDVNQNAYYVLNDDNDTFAYLSLESFRDTDCAADKVSLGALTRFDEDDVDEVSGETYLSAHPDARKVGGYYYIYTSPQAQCTEDEALLSTVDATRQSFAQGVAELVAR